MLYDITFNFISVVLQKTGTTIWEATDALDGQLPWSM